MKFESGRCEVRITGSENKRGYNIQIPIDDEVYEDEQMLREMKINYGIK